MNLPASSIRKAIAAAVGVQALVVDRVYVLSAPQNEQRDRIILAKTDDIPQLTSGGREYLAHARFSVVCLADTPAHAHAIALAAAAALRLYVNATDAPNITQWVKIGPARDVELVFAEGQEAAASGVSMDITAQYIEQGA